MNLPDRIDRIRRKTLPQTLLCISIAMGIWACNQDRGSTNNENWRCKSQNQFNCPQGSDGSAGASGSGNSSEDSEVGGGGSSGLSPSGAMPNGSWARSVTAGNSDSSFQGNAIDPSGNVYVVGYQLGSNSYSYGTGVTITATSSSRNAVIVKYDAAGNALWARTITSGTNLSVFSRVKTDGAGNVYAVGHQHAGTFVYGSGVSAAGSHGGENPIIVKYDSDGNAIWARTATISSGTAQSGTSFRDLVIDVSGNIFVVGYQGRGATYDYGNGISSTPPNVSSGHAMVIKYNSDGLAQWGRTVSSATSDSGFNGVTLDSWGNIYAAGYQQGNSPVNYGSGVSASATYLGANALVVKYDSTGTAKWAKTVFSGTSASAFNGIAVDNLDNIYAAGYQTGNGIFTYGVGVTATAPYAPGQNALLVKYNSTGTAKWARVPNIAPDSSTYNGVAASKIGAYLFIYAVGEQRGGVTFSYDFSTNATGASANVPNAVTVRYSEAGNAEWAKSTTSSSLDSHFNGAALNSAGNLIACGYQAGNILVYYTLPLSIAGTSGGAQNATLLRYF